ncbi:MAG: DUF4169 family protein [Paracraurococcus sp.]|jgi:hypothetical protein
MGDVVNLNRVRKARAKAEAATQAAANRARYGRNAAEKENDRRAEARRQALLEGARRDTPEMGAPAEDAPAGEGPA